MYRWILVGWMFVISAIAYLDRVNLSIAGRAIEEEFHFSDIQLGYILSAFVLGYALFQALGGRIADRFWPSAALRPPAGPLCFSPARARPRQHPWVSPQELAHIEAGLPPEDPKLGPRKLDWGAIFSNRDVLAVAFSYFCFGYTAYIFLSWFFIYLNKVRGLDLIQIDKKQIGRAHV